MRIAVLGAVAIDDEIGELNTLRAHRPRLVLARLAIDAGRAVATSELHEDVWMGAGTRAVVKTTISRLRGHLGDATAIRSDGDRYALDMEVVDLDLHRFDALVGAADEAVASGDVGAAISLLGSALALWRGPAFADCDAPFADVERHRLQLRRLDVEEYWLRLRVRSGDGAALDDLVARATARPDRVLVVVAAMEALHTAGRTREAISMARTHTSAVADAWGLLPAPEVVALERRLLTNDPLLAALGPHDRLTEQVGPAAPLPFVGRDAELDRLVRQMTGVNEQARPALVVGEPGMGKSALLRAAATRVEALDVPTVFAGCARHPDHTLEPIVQLVDAIVARLDDDDIRRIDASGGVAFRHLVPSLDCRLAPRADHQVAVGRRELIDEIVRFVGRTLAAGVVVIDDLQWADDVSLDVLARIHAAPTGPRLVGAVRSAALADVVATFDSHGGVDVISVGGLDEPDVRTLLELLPDTGVVDDSLPRVLADATGGSPLFLLSLLGPAKTVDGLERQLAGDRLPESAVEAVSHRLAALDAEVVELLEAAAVLGNPFPVALLLELECGPEDRLHRATKAGVVRVDDAGFGWFSHDLLAEALYQRTAAGRRIDLHDRIANLLLASGASAIQVGRHALEAAEIDPRRAVTALRDAATDLADAFDHHEAGRRLDEALDLLADLGARGTRLETEVLLQRGAMAVAAGEPEHVELLLRAADQGRDDDDLFVDAVTELCDFTAASDGLASDSKVAALLDDALARPADPARACRLALAASVFLSLSQQHDRARELFAAAWVCVHELGEDFLLDSYLYNAGVVLSGPDDLEERQRAAELLRSRRDRSLRLEFASAYLSWSTAMIVGDGDGVDRAFSTRPPVEALADDPGVYFGAAFADAARAHIRGHLDEADHHLGRAIERGLQWGSPGPFMASLGAILFAVRDAQGRLAEVAPMFGESLERVPDHPMLRAHVAVSSLVDGDPAPAIATLSDLRRSGFVEVPRDVTWSAAMVLYARAAHATGDRDAAARIHELLSPYTGRMSTIGVATYGPIDLALARTALTSGDRDLAHRHLDAVNDITARLRAPLMRTEASALRATLEGAGTR